MKEDLRDKYEDRLNDVLEIKDIVKKQNHGDWVILHSQLQDRIEAYLWDTSDEIIITSDIFKHLSVETIKALRDFTIHRKTRPFLLIKE